MSEREKEFLEIKKSIEQRPFARKNITAKSSDRLNYIKYRLLRPLFKLRYNRFQKKNPSLPWLCPDAITALNTLLSFGKGIEYGSGRSTLFFSGLLDELHSVEHHRNWFKQVQEMLSENKIENTTLHLIPADQNFKEPSLTSEEQYFLTTSNYPIDDSYFQSYINFLDKIEDESMDFILVDGRARRSCALKAMSKIKKGGILVLDNSERKRYDQVHKAFIHYPQIFTTTGLTDTTIWLKN